MSTTPSAPGAPGAPDGVPERRMTLVQASFIGVGAMVGAGIFALLGAAGEVAGAAVWLSFLLAGVIAALQGYSFGKLGAKYPSEGGMLEYLAQGFGGGTSPTPRRGWCSRPTRSSRRWSPRRSAATRAPSSPARTRTGPRCSPAWSCWR